MSLLILDSPVSRNICKTRTELVTKGQVRWYAIRRTALTENTWSWPLMSISSSSLNKIFESLKGLNFGHHLHSQDDVIWSCSYNKKLLSSHCLSAYRIWTNLDYWLLRYQIMRISDCAHAHYGFLATFIITKLDREHW